MNCFHSLLVFVVSVMSLMAVGESAFASHPFHVTRSEIEYNPSRQTFEVAVCVWPEDLERAVSKLEKRDVKIDDESEANRDVIFSRYVAKTFQFAPMVKTKDTVGDKSEKREPVAAKIRWIGSELEVKQGWLYFEVDAKTSAKNWTIENRMFFELNDDQLNQVQIRNGKLVESQTLSLNQAAARWSLNAEETSRIEIDSNR